MRLLPFALGLPLVALAQQSVPLPAPHHEANFDEERTRADELYKAGKVLEALPLYEDLCRQDQTIAVFAERHAGGLFARENQALTDKEKAEIHHQAVQEILRAQKLGDNSRYVTDILGIEAKSLLGSVMTGIPLSVGYTYQGTPEAREKFAQGEAAFGRNDMSGALGLYLQSFAADPKFYAPALTAGDVYFRLKDYANAGIWFAKAISIDPDRETAWRYWGDSLYQSGDRKGAFQKFVQAMVAEPYNRASRSSLQQWAEHNGYQFVMPAITRPEFHSTADALTIDPALAASTQDGRSSWILYQQYRFAHGARTLNQLILAGGTDRNGVTTVNGYQHTIAEEHAALRAMLADIDTKLKDGELTEANLDPSIANIRKLEKLNMLGAWIAISAPDAGIRQDYPKYRSNHREHLVEYVNTYLFHAAQ